MMAEGGPVFLHLDGCHMDEEFAFSFHETKDKWLSEQFEWEEVAREWEKERAVIAKMPLLQSPWQKEFWGEGSQDATNSPEFQLVAIAACLAELGLDLKGSADSAPKVRILNRHFGNLREVARQRANTLLRPVVDKVCDELQEVAEIRPDLLEKCLDLQRRLDDFVPSPQIAS
jgi:hypothetical protein